MSPQRKRYFLRHGESTWNVQGLSNADPDRPGPLTETGRAQAAEAAKVLGALPIRRIYVSRLPRAQETAAIINARLGVEIRVDARLDDRRTGLEGGAVQDYLAQMKAAPDPFAWKTPAGESYLDMVARVHAFLDVLARDPAEAVLVVSHHEPLQAVAGRYARLAPEGMWRVWVNNGEWLEFTDG